MIFVTQDQGWPLLNSNLSVCRSDSRQLLQVSHRLKVAASLSPYWIAPPGLFLFPPVSNRALHCQFINNKKVPLRTWNLNFAGRKKNMNKPSPETVLASKGDWRAAGFISLKIPRMRRTSSTISKAPAIALQGEVTLQVKLQPELYFQSHKINDVADVVNSHRIFSILTKIH